MWGRRRRVGTYTAQLTWALLSLAVADCLQIQTTSPTTAEVGKGVTLSVTYDSPRPPLVTWRVRGRVLAWWTVGGGAPTVGTEVQHRLQINTSGASLTFNRTELGDTAIYNVTLQVVNEDLVTGSVSLRVYERISRVGVSIPAADVKEGDPSITLRCTQDSGTWDTLSWSKDRKPVPQDEHFFPGGSELTIRRVVRGDAGVYACSLQNPYSNGSAQGRLHVFYGPDVPAVTISSTPGSDPSHFVLVNASVNLTCTTSSEPPALYYWNVGGSGDPGVPADPVLSLFHVQRAQAGEYTCIVVNSKIPRSVRGSVTLNVYELPAGNLSCSMESAGNNMALSLTCQWPGGFPPAQLRWEGLSAGVSARERLQVNESSPAALNGRKLTCVGTHPAANGSCVVSPASPRLVLSRLVSTDPRGFAVVTVTCKVVADPATGMHWYKDQRELGNDSVVEIEAGTSEVRIRDFSLANDTGNYSCSATNPLGSSQQILQLTAPLLSAVSVFRVNSSTVLVSWAVRRSDVVTAFQVQSGSSITRSESWKTLVVAGMSERQASVSGLQGDRGYSFRVLPMVGLQEGAASQPQSVDPTQAQNLTPGAIIGIVVGCVAGLLLIALIITYILWRRHRRKQTPTSQKPAVTTAPLQNTSSWDPRPWTAERSSPRSAQPATLYPPGPQSSRPPHSFSHGISQDWDIQSSVYTASPYRIPPANGSQHRGNLTPRDTLSSNVKPSDVTSHRSSDKPSTLSLQRRKATMV